MKRWKLYKEKVWQLQKTDLYVIALIFFARRGPFRVKRLGTQRRGEYAKFLWHQKQSTVGLFTVDYCLHVRDV